MARIVYILDEKDGSFTAGELDSGVTSYAYPTSENANLAKRMPERIASEMVESAIRWRGACYPDLAQEYDKRNWRRLGNADSLS